MEEKGYLLLVLHTHLPFVRNPETEHQLEESWLFEAISECYIPLIEIFKELIRDGADFKITLSLTPPLIEMLNDPLLQKRYIRYIEERILLTEKEIERLKNQNELLRLARMYYGRFIRYKKFFKENINQNMISEFKYLKNSKRVEIIASSATHAYFPLWELFPQIVDLQIQLGVQQYQNIFDTKPIGFWLPECGFSPNVDKLLQKNGVKYFFLDKHSIINGHPSPRFGEFAPIHCPSEIAAFARDWESHNIVWLKDRGYCGDSCYLNYDKDIGFELEQDYLSPFTHQDIPIKTGIKYFCSEPIDALRVYNPEIAFKKCDEHANHFIDKCQKQVENLYASLGKKPVIVALFDTELFGHWWYEGPTWLNLVIRKLAYDQKTVKLITAVDYLKMYPTNQVVTPSMSSWGYERYSETWLMGRNHWIYPKLYEAIELLEELIEINPMPQMEYRFAVNQYLRELLLAQSSDWAFMMFTQKNQSYAERRVEEHLQNMKDIYTQVKQNNINIEWLKSVQNKNNIFQNMDLSKIYRKILRTE